MFKPKLIYMMLVLIFAVSELRSQLVMESIPLEKH